MTGLQLSGSAKLTVIWIILECYYVVSLILRLIRLILVFHCKFCTFRPILFYIISFFNSYPRLIKPDMEGGQGGHIFIYGTNYCFFLIFRIIIGIRNFLLAFPISVSAVSVLFKLIFTV